MTDTNPPPLQARPLAEKPVEGADSPDIFVPHEGQLDGFLSREDSDTLRARQKSRARAMGLLLGAAALLFFAITIVKTGAT